jgi:hypothetical protein
MNTLTTNEIKLVSGGYRMYSATLFLEGLGAAIVGGALTVAGLGTPISIGGAALAAEGAAAMGVGLLDAS